MHTNFSIRSIFLVITIIFMTTALVSPASAHRVKIFAYVENGKIYSESYFSSKDKVHNGDIQVLDSNTNTVLLSGTTNSKGEFSFKIPKEIIKNKAGLKLILDASEGHRAEWDIPYNEIMPTDNTTLTNQKQSLPLPKSKHPTSISSQEFDQINQKLLRIEGQITTIKRLTIAQAEASPGIKDVFSGLGYIFGIFGLYALLKSRKKRS